jgi:hypothetical protein
LRFRNGCDAERRNGYAGTKNGLGPFHLPPFARRHCGVLWWRKANARQELRKAKCRIRDTILYG